MYGVLMFKNCMYVFLLSSTVPVFSGGRVCPLVLFPLAIVVSVLRFKDSDYPFGIFKFFLIKVELRPPF